MGVLEIKNDLLRLIGSTDNLDALESVHTYFKALKKEEMTTADLEEQEQRMIDIGLQQIEEGKVMSDEKAKDKIKQLFKNLKHE